MTGTHKAMWTVILINFVLCSLLVYLLMTGKYTSPLCLKKCCVFY